MYKSNISKMLLSFSQLVELSTISRWLAASALGLFFFANNFPIDLDLFKFIYSFLSIFLVLCYAMAINDCFDVEDDVIKSKLTDKKLVVSQEISVKRALLISSCMLFLGLVVSFFVSKFFFLVVILIVLLSTLYSVPPVRYKKRFPLSTLGEFAGSMLPFILGYVMMGPVDYRAIIVSVFFALITMYWRFFHEGYFYEVDRQTGKLTFAVVYGQRVTKILRRACLLVSTLEALILFTLGWFSNQFFIFLGLYLVFALGFWYWFGDYIPEFIKKNVLNSTWGFFFVLTVLTILVS